MNTRLSIVVVVVALILPLMLTGCGRKLKATRTGFLSDYSQLEEINERQYLFTTDWIVDYDAMMVDPIVFEVIRDPPVLNEEQRAKVAVYFNEQLLELLDEKNVNVTRTAGVGVARLRIAITDVKKSTFLLNLHPGSKLTGAGLGGAAMEGEVIDSVSGAQLAAVVQAKRGNQFELDTFSAIDDIKDVIHRWVRDAGERIDEMREQRAAESSSP